MDASNDRQQFDADLSHCGLHPERHAVGWAEMDSEGAKGKYTVGVCDECKPAPDLRAPE